MDTPAPINSDIELRQRREAIVHELVEIENTKDFGRLTSVFPHPRYELVGNSRVYDGVDECLHYLKDRAAAFPDYHIDIIALHHAVDAVIAEVLMVGTHRGRIEDFDPTGKGFRCRMASFLLFDGDRLRCSRTYFDHATVARQLA